MFSIAGQHNGRRIYTDVYILDAKSYSDHKQHLGGTPYPAGPIFKALIDTGATSTLISPQVVGHLGGAAVTQNQYETAMGPLWLFAYLFYVAFKQPIESLKEATVKTNNFTLRVAPPLISGGCVNGSPGFDVLLGMDIIATGQLRVESRTYTFEF